METLYHITHTSEVATLKEGDSYTPKAYSKDGFIHCSYKKQVCEVADRLYRGSADLVLLEIDRNKVECTIIDENLEGGSELFPHIYGELPMSAVYRLLPFPCRDDGGFDFPSSAMGT